VPIINEKDMIEIIKSGKEVILLEPNYPRKYPPLGLMKIATMLKGKKVYFHRFAYNAIFFKNVDLVCITSLFTYDLDKVQQSINDVKKYCPKAKILLGGIAASLITNEIDKQYPDIFIFKGYSKILDENIPDYNIDWKVEDPYDKYSIVFTTRGCVNKCGYCAVPRIEPGLWINPIWKDCIKLDKKYVMIFDNNIPAFPGHALNVISYLVKIEKKVMFENGLDCKWIDNKIAGELAKINYVTSGLRLAFDRISDEGIFQKSIKLLLSKGISKYSIMAYALFNFTDNINEANYRMRECVRLKIRPYPQQYSPLNITSRDNHFIGKHWDKITLRAFRNFWLLAGYYQKMTFNEWLDMPKGPGQGYTGSQRTNKNE
jgi:hypothetical protein